MKTRQRIEQELKTIDDERVFMDEFVEDAKGLRLLEQRAIRIVEAANRIRGIAFVRRMEMGDGHYERTQVAYPQAQVGSSYYKDAPEVHPRRTHTSV